MADTFERVAKQITEVFQNKGSQPPALSPESVLDASFGLDSLDYAELVTRLEQEFGKDPFAEDIPVVSTLADLVALYH